MRTTLSIIAASLLFVAGCGKESEKGGPGAKTANQSSEAAKDAKENTFSIVAPSTTTTIEQGKRETVKLELKRGDKFTQPVRLSFDAKGLIVSPAEFKENEKEVTVTVEATPDATLGETTVKVTGTPATGDPASVDFPVKVTKP